MKDSPAAKSIEVEFIKKRVRLSGYSVSEINDFLNQINDDDDNEKKSHENNAPSKSDSDVFNNDEKVIIKKLIIYKGIADNDDKVKLRDAFNNGAVILIDLHDITQKDFEEEGKDFITFMGGVAFAKNGFVQFIEPAQYLVIPGVNMYEIWQKESNAE